MAHEIAELVARAVIGGEYTIVAARDDGFAIGGETVGQVGIAIRGVAGDGGNRAPVLRDVENGFTIAIGAALSMAEREAAKAGLRAAEGAGLRLAKRYRRAKRALAQRQGQCLLKRGRLINCRHELMTPADAPPIGREPRRPDQLPLAGEPQRLAIGSGAGLARMRVPEVDLHIVAAAGRRPAPVWAEGRGHHDIVVAGIGDDLLAAGDVVDVALIARSFASARQQELAIRAEAQGAHHRPLPGQHAQKAAVAPVPQPDFAGPVAAGDGAIRRDGKASHLAAMAGHVRDLLAIGHAPQP